MSCSSRNSTITGWYYVQKLELVDHCDLHTIVQQTGIIARELYREQLGKGFDRVRVLLATFVQLIFVRSWPSARNGQEETSYNLDVGMKGNVRNPLVSAKPVCILRIMRREGH